MSSRVPVLMYHRVGPKATDWDSHYSVTAKGFASHVEALAHAGYTACSLDDFRCWLDAEGTLPPKSVLITFDDGFCGVHDFALPVLREHRWPFTVFVVTGKLGKPADWAAGATQDRSRSLMGHAELENVIAGGGTLQSHSASHWDLSTLSDALLAEELRNSRERLHAITRFHPFAIAYPYGRYDARVVDAATKAGYALGFSVTPGFNRPDAPRMALRRLDITGTDTAAHLLRKVTYGTNDGSIGQSIKYMSKQLAMRLKVRSGVSAL